jgi:endonuclease/exonuclease/phosphatase family metal-dependent hydrolase
VIVAGDMNMTDQTDAYRALAGRLQDAQHEAGCGFGHTFPAYGGRFRDLPIFPRMVRIDMVFHSDEWAAVECRVLSGHGQSDHLPVMVRLVWSQ